MWNKIKMFFINLVHRFVYSAKDYHDAIDGLNALKAQLAEREETIDSQKKQLDFMMQKMTETYDRLESAESRAAKAEIDATLFKRSSDKLTEQLKIRNTKIAQFEEYKRVDAEYLREVQKQLSEEFGMHPVFGFPRSPGLPGSTSISAQISRETMEDPGFTVTRGRVILDDQTTKQINAAPHIYEKLNIVLDFMARYGTLSKIVNNIIRNGGMSITLGYREATTTYEMFYEVTAKNYIPESILVFDPDTGCVVKNEEEG